MKSLSLKLIATLLVVSVLSSSSAYAYDENFYSSNDILFYQPDDNTCIAGSALSGGNNLDYAGKNILSSSQLKAMKENLAFYQKAADAADIPWQLLAAVHFKETGLKRYGPSNGYGPFQITPSTYPVSDSYTDDQFQDAANKAALLIKNKSDNKDLSKLDNIKYTLFAYNGTADVYERQAISLGFTKEQAANGEGSPYVMNRFDLKRDPTVEPTKSNNTWGQIVKDHGSLEYPANSGYGTYVVYLSLSGLDISGGCGSGALVSGGMTLKQAKAFMLAYKNGADSIDYLADGYYTGCVGGNIHDRSLANCVAFSVYFINKYTSLTGFKSSPTGNGSDIVKNIVDRNDGVTSGTVPRPYSIFSSPATATNDAGHTGVILGVDTEKGVAIVGEASCSRGFDWIDAREYPLSSFSDDKTYAYLEGYIKGL